MRRRSTAQSLLSPFKSSSVPPPSPSRVSIGTNNNVGAGGTNIPTHSTEKESVDQSVYAKAMALSHPSGATSSQPSRSTSVEYLRDLIQKRVIMLRYIRNTRKGHSQWFHTVLIFHTDLEREFSNNNPEIRKRTIRFAVLGMALSNLLVINSPQDLLRGLIQKISEYEQDKDDGEKPQMRRSRGLFRSKFSKRGGHDSDVSLPGNLNASYLMLDLPFPLDYHQTLLSLLDVISEVYSKISKVLGPVPFPHSSQHMTGPPSLLSPYPAVSYIQSGDNTPADDVNALQHSMPSTQYHSSSGRREDMSGTNPSNCANGLTGLVTPSPNLAALSSFGESVLEFDRKITKITSTLLSELDAFAQNVIKNELTSLDPLFNTVEPIKQKSLFKPDGGHVRMAYDPSNELASPNSLLDTVELTQSESFSKPGGGHGRLAHDTSNKLVSPEPRLKPESLVKPGGGRGRIPHDTSNELVSFGLQLNIAEPNQSESFVKPGGGRGRIAHDTSNERVSFGPLLDSVEPIKPEFFLKPGGGRGYTAYDPGNELLSPDLRRNACEPIQLSFSKPDGTRIQQ